MTLARNFAAGLCLLCLTATSALAEDVSKGLVLGFNESELTPAPAATDTGLKTGAVVGGFLTIPFGKRVGLTLEAEYSQKHSKATSGTVQTNTKLDYLAVPIMGTVSLFSGFYTTDGVSVAFPIQARTETVGSTKATEIKSTVTNPDVDLIISAGHALGTPNVKLEVRYDAGLRQVIKTAGAFEQKTRSFAILGRVAF